MYGALSFNAFLLAAKLLSIQFPQISSLSQFLVGILAAFFIGALKEGVDGYTNYKITGDPRVGPHGFELMDAVATWIGGLIAAFPVFILVILPLYL